MIVSRIYKCLRKKCTATLRYILISIPVKAAGVLCVLGISFGIGAYVMYKIYNRFIRPSVRRKPPKSCSRRGKHGSYGEEDEDIWDLEAEEEMGNQQSNLKDIPVYYKAGFGVSLYNPLENSTKVRNRKNSQTHANKAGSLKIDRIAETGEAILKGNLKHNNKNGLQVGSSLPYSELLGETQSPEKKLSDKGSENHNLESSNANGNHGLGVDDSDGDNVRVGRGGGINQLHIEIDESGFVEEDIGVDGDRLSNSLKGNFSPTSLCEKNFRIGDHGDDGGNDEVIPLSAEDVHLNNSVNAQNNANTYTCQTDCSKHDHLKLGPNLGASSVLLTPPSEDENSSDKFVTGSEKVRNQSTKSDISDIKDEIADELETDEECEQFSPLPYDKSPHKSPRKLCPKKLKLKLNEIAAQSSAGSGNTSSGASPESSVSLGNQRTRSVSGDSHKGTSVSGDRENSISGISSPELEMLNSEVTENPVVYAGAFNNLEDEIHGVEDEFETISREIRQLSTRYSGGEAGSQILMDIFQRYPSIRVRQAERGIDFTPSATTVMESESSQSQGSRQGSRQQSEMGDNSVDLSWDLENMLDALYSDNSEALAQNFPGLNIPDQVMEESMNSQSGMDNSVNCTVDLDGSTYEDEFHLHLGTRPLSKIDETSTEPSADPSPSIVEYAKMVVSMEFEDEEPRGDAGANLDTNPASNLDSPSVDHLTESGIATSESINMSVNPSTDSEMVTANSNLVSTSVSDMVDAGDSGSSEGVSAASDVPATQSSSINKGNDNVTAMANIGERVEVTQYADSEWKGETQTAKLLRKAYRAIPDHCQCCHLRRIRGDNYCGIRGTVYQTLINKLPPFHHWASRESVVQHLTQAYHNRGSGIRKWNFARRISYSKDTKLEVMQRCVATLYAKIEEMGRHSSYRERDDYLVNLLNSDPDCDLDLMEGVKLLMALSAIRMYSDMEQGKDVPVFAWLLFARDSSTNVPSFVRNHLNQVGNAGGLEQIEMCLLGYSLGVRIRVLRLRQLNDEDFVSYYPEDGTDTWPVITLIAEDDRHYNVPVL